MEMTEGEICREYRMAKDKRRQIRILADENCTDPEEIKGILICGGETLQDAKIRIKCIKGRKTGEKREEDRKETGCQEMLIAEMERLDSEIAELEKRYFAVVDKVKQM